MPAMQPSQLGHFALGYSRLGVYTDRWQKIVDKGGRSVTWRVANINVTRDSTTGHRIPTYNITHTIQGVIEERGGNILPLPSGYVQRGDAVFFCFDNVTPLDQIYMPESKRYYEAQYVRPVYEYLPEQNKTSFCYRMCDLKFLELFKEV